MTGIYLVEVVGTGTRIDRWRLPSPLDSDTRWKQLMIDTVSPRMPNRNNSRMAALGVHPSNALPGSGATKIASAANPPALITLLGVMPFTNSHRDFIDGYTDAAGLNRLPTTSWWEVLLDLLQQVEPAVNLEQKILSAG